MLDVHLTRTADQLKRALGTNELSELGRRSGFEKRARLITTARFVSSLLSSLGGRKVESIADLLRDFNFNHGTQIYYKPFYNRLDVAGFPELMRQVFQGMMSSLCSQVLRPEVGGPFESFKDIVLHDGTSFALHDDLAGTFRGRFTTVNPAAVELHTTMSLFGDNFTCVQASSDSECERHFVPKPSELCDKLLLADRGYDSTEMMRSIAQQGGHFVIRVRSSHDPKVVKIHRTGARYRKLEGRQLSAVVKSYRRAKCMTSMSTSRELMSVASFG